MTCHLSLIYVCDHVKILYLHDGFSFNPALTNYDINADIDTKVEIYQSSYFQLKNFQYLENTPKKSF